MKLSKATKKLAKELDLSEADAFVIELKAKLYERAANSIKTSNKSHEEISQEVGTSRARITRISNMGENSVSIELLMKIIICIEKKIPFSLVS